MARRSPLRGTKVSNLKCTIFESQFKTNLIVWSQTKKSDVFKYDVVLVKLKEEFDPDIATPICLLPKKLKKMKNKPKNTYYVSGKNIFSTFTNFEKSNAHNSNVFQYLTMLEEVEKRTSKLKR